MASNQAREVPKVDFLRCRDSTYIQRCKQVRHGRLTGAEGQEQGTSLSLTSISHINSDFSDV